MPTSRAVKPRRHDTLLSNWEHAPDQAPSLVRQDQPTAARVIALIGLFLILVGLIPVFTPIFKIERTLIDASWGFFFATTGVMLVLFHAFVDRDPIFRRMYGYLGMTAIALALLLRVIPSGGVVGGRFALAGFPALLLGLVLLIATLRSETEQHFRKILLAVLGIVGAIEILAAVGVGLFSHLPFLAGEGGIHLIMGLLFVGTYIGQQDSEDAAYYAGLGLGAVGLIAFGGGLIRSRIPESYFLVPNGLILMSAGVVYLTVAAGVCLDWPIVVMTRRELASYFYSPVAYLVLVGMVIVGWYMFYDFIGSLAEASLPMMGMRRRSMFEPIFFHYLWSIIPVVMQMFIVPAITMRLFAEEKRSGTLEVLLTAPVRESTVVLAKFLSAWLFYLFTWLPWLLYLVALATVGGTEFDYRPMLSFDVTLLALGSGFIAMGLFFSALTSNQIIAAVLAFVGMLAPLAAYQAKFDLSESSTLFQVLSYVSYLDVWWGSGKGIIVPRLLVFHVSLAVFFLYATVQVLDMRKWK